MHTNTAFSVHRLGFFVYYSARRRLCAQGQRFCPLVRVTVYVVNELVLCFSFQNLCDAQKKCRLCAQGLRLCTLAYVIVSVLQQPVQLLLTTGARRHRFIYAKPYRLMAMHGQNDKKIYRHSVDRKT
jgi:hypothetical protein